MTTWTAENHQSIGNAIHVFGRKAWISMRHGPNLGDTITYAGKTYEIINLTKLSDHKEADLRLVE